MSVGPAEATSVGTTSEGSLEDGFRVPLTGRFHRFYGPVRARGTHYATLEMAALLVRAARVVADELGGPPLVLGDISSEEGGDLARHASHNSGRDVDILPYRLDARGQPEAASRFVPFDAADPRFDDARNWWLLRTLIASQRPAVQYVFVARPLRARLLAWARSHDEHPEILRRAVKVLRQPGDSSAHADHFHVRIYCSAGDLDRGCVDTGPRWSWVGKDGRAAPIADATGREAP